MGFIEDLRKQKAAEGEVAERARGQERLREERLKEEKEEAKRLREKAVVEEKERIRVVLDQSKEHFLNSDFPRLIKGLASILPDLVIHNLTHWSWSDEDVKDGKEHVDASYLRKGKDPNLEFPIADHTIDFYMRSSAPPIFGLMLIWPTGNERNSYHESTGDYHSWDSQYNVIPIICSVDGTITLGIRKSKKKLFGQELIKEITLPASIWKGNSGIQEESLAEAYNNARFFWSHRSSGQSGEYSGSGRDGM